MKARSVRAKGHRGQKRVVAALYEYLKPNIPWLTKEDIREREGSCNGCDIIFSPQLLQLFPYSIEVKWRAKLPSWDKITKTGPLDKAILFFNSRTTSYFISKFPNPLLTEPSNRFPIRFCNQKLSQEYEKWVTQAVEQIDTFQVNTLTPLVFMMQNRDKNIYVLGFGRDYSESI